MHPEGLWPGEERAPSQEHLQRAVGARSAARDPGSGEGAGPAASLSTSEDQVGSRQSCVDPQTQSTTLVPACGGHCRAAAGGRLGPADQWGRRRQADQCGSWGPGAQQGACRRKGTAGPGAPPVHPPGHSRERAPSPCRRVSMPPQSTSEPDCIPGCGGCRRHLPKGPTQTRVHAQSHDKAGPQGKRWSGDGDGDPPTTSLGQLASGASVCLSAG